MITYLKHTLASMLLYPLASLSIFAQEGPERFQKEVNEIVAHTPVPDQSPVYLFTGSSSVRMWKDIADYFPDATIVNTGFGGSQAHELLHFSEELIFRYHPDHVFIYEGDNDLASGKTPVEVFNTMKKLVTKIQSELPQAQLILISPKPSPSRWHLKENYLSLNRLLKIYCEQTDNVHFADVWDIALGANGRPQPEIFLADSLHMNSKGYDQWASVLDKFIP